MEYLMLVLVTCMTLGSQLVLKKAINVIGPLMQSDKIAFLIAAITSPYVIMAIVMQGLGYFLDVCIEQNEAWHRFWIVWFVLLFVDGTIELVFIWRAVVYTAMGWFTVDKFWSIAYDMV